MKRLLIALAAWLALVSFGHAQQATNYLEKKVMDHITGNASYTAPANLYLALMTTVPTETAAGTEVSGSGYSRQLMATGPATGNSATSCNTAEETFTASGSWGTVTAIAIYDASSGGNQLFYRDITDATVGSGDKVVFAVCSVALTMD